MTYSESAKYKYLCVYIDSYDRQTKTEFFCTSWDMNIFCRADRVYSVINTYELTEI